MGRIEILGSTPVNPITLIGARAGICYGSDVKDKVKNYKRGMECILNNHGRTLEFVNVQLHFDGYSARVIRELYTHIGGSPTRLQESTRYIDYSKKNFGIYCPPSVVNNPDAKKTWDHTVDQLREGLYILRMQGVPTEDLANLLPLGMETGVVASYNLRTLIDMSHQRECTRAYHEYRQLMKDLKSELSQISEEWKWIVENLFVPKCEVLGYCPEKETCGRKPKKS